MIKTETSERVELSISFQVSDDTNMAQIGVELARFVRYLAEAGVELPIVNQRTRKIVVPKGDPIPVQVAGAATS